MFFVRCHPGDCSGTHLRHLQTRRASTHGTLPLLFAWLKEERWQRLMKFAQMVMLILTQMAPTHTRCTSRLAATTPTYSAHAVHKTHMRAHTNSTHTHTHTHIRTNEHAHPHPHPHAHIETHVHAHLYSHMHTHAHANTKRTHTHTHTHKHKHNHESTHLRARDS